MRTEMFTYQRDRTLSDKDDGVRIASLFNPEANALLGKFAHTTVEVVLSDSMCTVKVVQSEKLKYLAGLVFAAKNPSDLVSLFGQLGTEQRRIKQGWLP